MGFRPLPLATRMELGDPTLLTPPPVICTVVSPSRPRSEIDDTYLGWSDAPALRYDSDSIHRSEPYLSYLRSRKPKPDDRVPSSVRKVGEMTLRCWTQSHERDAQEQDLEANAATTSVLMAQAHVFQERAREQASKLEDELAQSSLIRRQQKERIEVLVSAQSQWAREKKMSSLLDQTQTSLTQAQDALVQREKELDREKHRCADMILVVNRAEGGLLKMGTDLEVSLAANAKLSKENKRLAGKIASLETQMVDLYDDDGAGKLMNFT